MPTVSIVMPVYNAAAYIAEAIASVSTQTFVDWELLIIDDASNDDSASIAAAAAAVDPRIRLLRQVVNLGPAAARNRGLDAAQGEWIALLDADDSFTPRRLEQMIVGARAHDADLYSDNLLLIFAGSTQQRTMIPAELLAAQRQLSLTEFHRRNIADPAWPGVNFGFLKPIIRRAFIIRHSIRYDERIRFGEDFALYLECLAAGCRWWLCPEPGYRYRVRGDSLTQVQTVGDLGVLAVRLTQARDRAVSAGDGTTATIIQRHIRVVDRCRLYRQFTDELKARRFRAACACFFRSPCAALLITDHLTRQAPIIARKALHGGYKSSR